MSSINDKKRINVFSYVVLVLGMLLYLILSAYLYWKELLFNESNLEVSIIITSVFLLGMTNLILLTSLISIEENKILKFEPIDNIKEIKHSGSGVLYKRISIISSVYEMGKNVEYQDLKSISDREVATSGAYSRYAISICALLGLLGTFLGIVESVNGLENTLGEGELQFGLNKLIGGIDQALGTSIVGIIASMILGVFFIAYKNNERKIFTKLEEITLIKILPYFQIPEHDVITRAIIESMNRVLPKIVKESSDNLIISTTNLKEVTEGLALQQNEGIKIIKESQSVLAKLTEIYKAHDINISLFQAEIVKITSFINNIGNMIKQNSESNDDLLSSIDSVISEYVRVNTKSIEKNNALFERFQSNNNQTYNSIERILESINTKHKMVIENVLLIQKEYISKVDDNSSEYFSKINILQKQFLKQNDELKKMINKLNITSFDKDLNSKRVTFFSKLKEMFK